MSSFHWLIVIPYYFFTSLFFFLALSLVCRIARAGAGANTLAMTAIVASVVICIGPLVVGWLPLSAYTGWRMLGLGLATFVLAAVDAVLQPALSLPLDEELHDV